MTLNTRIFLKLENMIAVHATTSELGGFHAQLPITFYMLQGSNYFLHATATSRKSGISRFPEEEEVQL